MPSYSKHDVILVRYPFSDLSSSKVRPAVVVSTAHPSQDILITPLTSKTGSLLAGEFVLSERAAAGLNVATAVKRGVILRDRPLPSHVQQRKTKNYRLQLRAEYVQAGDVANSLG